MLRVSATVFLCANLSRAQAAWGAVDSRLCWKSTTCPLLARLMRDLYQCPSSRVLQQCWQLPHSCSPLWGGPGRVPVLSACLEAAPRPWGRCHPSEGLSPTSQGSAQGRALCPLLHVQRLHGRETCCGACM